MSRKNDCLSKPVAEQAAGERPEVRKTTGGDVRAAGYRARAQEALASVDNAGLERVREQRRQSAAVWNEMAETAERAPGRRLPRPRLATRS